MDPVEFDSDPDGHIGVKVFVYIGSIRYGLILACASDRVKANVKKR